ncbi:MAG: CZB domain-containing protein [Planctomycetota bacterium]|jgi:methyl-accepting chemotaxis protein
MTNADNIVRAIAAHAKWKYYLRQAIKTGKSEWTAPAVRVDDQCEFGIWLRSVAPADRLGKHWKTVQARHGGFHRAAADVLELALSGRPDEAEAAIAPGSRFAEVSKQLTLAMMAWKDDAAPQSGGE